LGDDDGSVVLRIGERLGAVQQLQAALDPAEFGFGVREAGEQAGRERGGAGSSRRSPTRKCSAAAAGRPAAPAAKPRRCRSSAASAACAAPCATSAVPPAAIASLQSLSTVNQ